MVKVSENGKSVLKLIFADFLTDYNSYNIKDEIGLSNAGSLKLLRSLDEKGLLVSKRMGNAIFYKPNLKNEYLLKLLELSFMETENLPLYVKGWIEELKAFIPHNDAIFLFGSLLKKGKEARDIDVCFVLKNPGDYIRMQSQIKKVNAKSRIKIHPLYITERELERKLKERDKPLIEMVRGCIVVYGQDVLVRVLKNVHGSK